MVLLTLLILNVFGIWLSDGMLTVLGIVVYYYGGALSFP
jgi:hypothetical protein